MTRIYAHRGASGYAPENTNAAFDLALTLPIDGIETDIRATRDGTLVLLHDATVDRTTDGAGPVSELSLAEVRRLDAGVRFAAAFSGQRVPTLDEFLDRYGHRTHFWLEIKAPGVEAALVEAVQRRQLMDAVQFTSFNFQSLERVRAVSAAAEVGFLTREMQPDTIDRCLGIQTAMISLHHSNLTPVVMQQIRGRGMDVRTWGIDTKEVLRKALALDVYGLTLNWPDWATVAERPRAGT